MVRSGPASSGKGFPIIGVDSMGRSPVPVNDHDFRPDASGVGISYGIYSLPHNRDTVCVGVSPDTAAFAAHSIAT
ncbi:MAG: ISAzo13-like element transposase-related protein [Bryobacteraceae bacterium]